ncbi:MAG: MarR family transcriptional regulator [Ilumatobacteraceae bacterium]|nr:MarR family transcriptional regulator [Ilumatobacteraceae bacterium]
MTTSGPKRHPAPAGAPPEVDESVWDPVDRAAAHWRRAGWTNSARLRAALSILRVEDLIRGDNTGALEPLQLTHARHEALAILFFSRHGEMKLSELGQRLLLHPTSITSTVDSLERLGYVERVPHAHDRRATMARITASGRSAFSVSATAMSTNDHSLTALTDAEAQELFRLLRKVRAAAGDITTPRHDGATPTP